jgi:hypothetical protein
MRKPFFAERNSVWQLVGAATAAVAAAEQGQPEGEETIAECDGAAVIKNHDAERIQIKFATVPGPALRARLKGAGWRWSPTNSAWQRQITNASIYSAKLILADFVALAPA